MAPVVDAADDAPGVLERAGMIPIVIGQTLDRTRRWRNFTDAPAHGI
jgi:hypothetical protein